MQIAHLYNTII